jgi:signal transduction histidine kinase
VSPLFPFPSLPDLTFTLYSEIRTPLNCVQIGIELALLQMRSNGEQKSQQSHHNHPSMTLPRPHPLSSDQITMTIDEKMNGDQSIVELLEDTYLSCQTAVEILNDILSYDKLEASDMKLNYSVVDVKSLLERCISPFSVQVSSLTLPSLLLLTVGTFRANFSSCRHDKNMFI